MSRLRHWLLGTRYSPDSLIAAMNLTHGRIFAKRHEMIAEGGRSTRYVTVQMARGQVMAEIDLTAKEAEEFHTDLLSALRWARDKGAA